MRYAIQRPDILSVDSCRRLAAGNADDSAAVLHQVEGAIWEMVATGRFGFVTVDVQHFTERAIGVARSSLVASGWDARVLRDPDKDGGDPTARAEKLVVSPP